LLDFALRLSMLDAAPGVGKVQRAMRTDLQDDTRRHCALQLEVGTLAQRLGCEVKLECRSAPRSAPSDVVLLRDSEQLRIETFAIVRDLRSQQAAAFWQRLLHSTRMIELRYGVSIAGDLGGELDEDAVPEMLHRLEQAAKGTA